MATRIGVAVAMVAFPFAVGLTWNTAVAAAVDRDCSDFPNQAAAQDYFLSKGGPSSDPDRLDQDGDGVACESLPCPCKGAPNTDLLVSGIFLAALLIVTSAFLVWQWRSNRDRFLEGSVTRAIAGLLIVSILGALLAVVNFSLDDPPIENIVPFLLGFLLPALAAAIMSAIVYAGKRPENNPDEERRDG